MQITKAQIKNYKSFRSSPEMTFSSGFNVVVGQNDAGKTALLEALSLQFGDHPHRSMLTIGSGMSSVLMTLAFSPEEVRHILRRSGPVVVDFTEGQELAAEQSFRTLLESNVNLECSVRPNGSISAELREYAPKGSYQGVLIFRWDDETNQFIRDQKANNGTRIAETLMGAAKPRIYAFRAERLHVGTSRFGTMTLLSPDARNLAEVLNNLQSNAARYQRFNQYVSTIFPAVRWVSVKAVPQDQVRIFVWSVDPDTEREDLAIPLNESGTGIGQVLAILYVTLTSPFPQTILIDEPQSFLHPGAVRKLIGILKQHSQHQFIITTHAPYALTEAEPGTVHLVRKEGMESTIDALDTRATDDLKLLLRDVGVRISDVFGVDRILWVEGSTEELCFPKIISGVSQVSALGTAIIGVENTGDFETRRKLNAFAIYEKLTSTGGVLPQAVRFVFDREGRSERERDDLIRRSEGKVAFLPRRLFENYLIHPAGIAQVISAMETFPGNHSAETVAQWIDTHRWEKRFFQGAADVDHRSEKIWLERGHGAKLLQALFLALSNNTVEYRKKEHGLLLTEWIIEHDPQHFWELADFLARALVPDSKI